MANKGIVLVAGVGGGLGFGICRRFAAAGYDVAMVSRKQERLAPLAERINENSGGDGGGGRAHVCPADIRDEATVEELFDRVEAEYGPIAAVVFNTGAQYRKAFLDIPPDLFEKVWRLGCYAAPNPACARWPRAWRANSGPRVSTSPMWSSMVSSTRR
jgi:NAD(P)-dependent dehydrogenase (short-subunit alcohol dehydrogenase family)